MKTFLKWFGRILLALLLVFAVFVATLLITEFKPKDQEVLAVSGESRRVLKRNKEISLISWNIGYGALGDNADFFMDGGNHVYTASKQRVLKNMERITDYLKDQNPDLIYLQEIDHDSSRSHHVHETSIIKGLFTHYQSTFATNFKVLYLPYPMPPMGKVHSGLMTLSKFGIKEATRIQLPIPFKFPVSVLNLKRCLSINRVEIEGSDKELVCINLHLEAYDSGQGKIEQTKMLKSILDAEVAKGNYVIAGGDFNQVVSTDGTSKYPVKEGLWAPGEISVDDFKDYKLAFDDSSPTCRSLDQPYVGADKKDFQFYVIDGFVVSKNVKINTAKTQQLNFVSSDHNPVKLTFTLQ